MSVEPEERYTLAQMRGAFGAGYYKGKGAGPGDTGRILWRCQNCPHGWPPNDMSVLIVVRGGRLMTGCVCCDCAKPERALAEAARERGDSPSAWIFEARDIAERLDAIIAHLAQRGADLLSELIIQLWFYREAIWASRVRGHEGKEPGDPGKWIDALERAP